MARVLPRRPQMPVGAEAALDEGLERPAQQTPRARPRPRGSRRDATRRADRATQGARPIVRRPPARASGRPRALPHSAAPRRREPTPARRRQRLRRMPRRRQVGQAAPCRRSSPVLEVAHRDPRVEAAPRARRAPRPSSRNVVDLGLARRARPPRSISQQHGARRLERRVRLHRGEGADGLERLDAVKLAAVALDPARAHARQGLERAAEPAPALAGRGARLRARARVLGEEGHDQIRLAELVRPST